MATKRGVGLPLTMSNRDQSRDPSVPNEDPSRDPMHTGTPSTPRTRGRIRATPVLQHLPRLADRFLLQSLYLRGYTSRHVPTSVGRVHSLECEGRGKLPPIVILHGLSAAGQYYENLMRRVRPHVRRVIAPDMPGHGYSDMPAEGLDQTTLGAGLREGLDQLMTEPAIVFGNSLGAAAAVRYASENPDRVLGLFLAAPGGAPMSEDELDTFVDAFMLDCHDKALDFVDRLFHRPPAFRHLLAWGVRQQFGREGIEELLRSVKTADFLRKDELAALPMPVTVLWGEADRILRPRDRSFFEENLPPHARLYGLREYGHVPHMCHPDSLSQYLIDFAREVARTPPR